MTMAVMATLLAATQAPAWRGQGFLAGRALPWARRQSAVAQGAEAAEEKAAEKSPAGDFLVQALLFLTYFATQSGMAFYMKFVLAKVHITRNLVGIPASFLVTSVQQISGFLLVLMFMGGSQLAGRPYKPKPLGSRKEVVLVLLLSLGFSLNIGLNLFSLALIPLSVVQIVRSCMPLSTALSQTLIQRKTQDISAGEWACMVFGVACAVVVVLAKSGGAAGASASPTFWFGVGVSTASIFCGAFDMVFKSILGTSVKLPAMDTIFYMALPVATITTLIGTTVSKPVSDNWVAASYGPRMTDLAVFKELWQLNPGVLGWVVASGALAFAYNAFQTFLVVKLSPATTSFAGNFNKAATVLLSLIFLEGKLPPGVRGVALVLAIAGNIASFALYNTLKGGRKK